MIADDAAGTASAYEGVSPLSGDGFVGMDVAGDISVVRMTWSKGTLRRKKIEDKGGRDAANFVEIPPAPLNSIETSGMNLLADRIANTGAVSVAVLATAAVNAAVAMRSLSAPSVNKSYWTRTACRWSSCNRRRNGGNQRWLYFVGTRSW